MNFELSEDQVAFADMARAFAQKELAPTPPSGIGTPFSPSR